MTAEQEQIERDAATFRGAAMADAEVWARSCLTYKDALGVEHVGLDPSEVQLQMFEHDRQCKLAGLPCKMIVYKSRRMGASTGAQGIIYHREQSTKDLTAKLMANKDTTAGEVSDIFKLLAKKDRFPWPHVKGAPVVQDIHGCTTLASGSVYKDLSARGEEPGRGGAAQIANLTESAFYPETGDPVGGFLPSVQAALTSAVGCIIADSTPNGPCYDDQTELLTDEGWKLFKDLHGREAVLTKNPETGVAYYQHEWHPVVQDWNGPMVYFSAHSVNFMVTPNHMMWLANQKGPMKFYRADRTLGKKTDYFFDRTFKWERPGLTEFVLPAYRHRRGNGWMTQPERHIPIDVWLTWLGHWLSDGGLLTKMQRKEANTTQTKFVDKFRASAMELARYLGTGVCDVAHSRGRRFIFNNAQLVEYLKDFHAPKRIPRELLMSMSKIQCRVLLESIYEGDGNQHKRNNALIDSGVIHAGIDKEFEDGIQELALKAGYSTTAYGPPRNRRVRFSQNARGKLTWDKAPKEIPNYQGRVYCVHLPKDHLLMVRRNRIAGWCGNSGWFYSMCMLALTREAKGQQRLGDWKLIFVPWWKGRDAIKPFPNEAAKAEFMADLRTDEIEEWENHDPKHEQITPEAMNWRRMIINDMLKGSVETFRTEYASSVREGFMRSARHAFNLREMQRAHTAATGCKTIKIGGMTLLDGNTKAAFIADENGGTRFWEDPTYGLSYIVIWDTMTGADQASGGKNDPDYHSIGVWRAEYQEHGTVYPARRVASHRSRLPIEVAAAEAHALSLHFGTCMIIPEVNNCGLAGVKALEALGARIFARKVANLTLQNTETANGWMTTETTRKTIIAFLAQAIRTRTLDVPDEEFWAECLSFVIDPKKGRPEAMDGQHDDRVMEAAIAVYNMGCASRMDMPTRRRVTDAELMRRGGLALPDGTRLEEFRRPDRRERFG